MKNNLFAGRGFKIDKFTFLKLYNFDKLMEILKNDNLYISEHDSKKVY